MFGNWLWSKLAADYEQRILAFDPDDLIRRCGLEDRLKNSGFDMIDMDAMDPIHVRYKYESEYRNSERKVLYIVHRPSTFIPYDIRKQCYEVRLDYESIFPKLNAGILRQAKSFDLSLLHVAYQNDFGGYRGEEGTKAFLAHDMFLGQNADEYVEWLRNSIRARLNNPQHYSDWFTIAKQWASLRMLRDGGFTNVDLASVSTQLERIFREWLLDNYKRLSASFHAESPVMLHKTNEYIRTRGNKLALIVVDGMSLENWFAFEKEDEIPGFSYDLSCAFAIIPTITMVSRLSLFSGRLPSEMSKPFALSNEEKEWRAYWKQHGYRDKEIAYLRGVDCELPSSAKVVGIIINTIDDIMHGQIQGQSGMYRDTVSWSKSGELQALILRLLERNFSVFITSDHGNVEAIGQGRPPGEGILTEVAGQRCRIYQEYADTYNIENSFRTISFPAVYLPKEFQYILSEEGLSFQTRSKTAICHGGMSLEEVIVPFIQVKGLNV